MKSGGTWRWTAASALGLGVGFLVYLQIPMIFRYGLDFERYWVWQEHAAEPSLLFYGVSVVALLAAGATFGAAQALVLRSRGVRAAPWILATAIGFLLLAAVFWPLAASGVLGIIPGPVEPILFTVGGCILAGICQYLALRGQGFRAARWLGLWIAGAFAGLVATAAFFMSIEGAGFSLGWFLDVFFSGFWVAGMAALISARALFAALPATRPHRQAEPHAAPLGGA